MFSQLFSAKKSDPYPSSQVKDSKAYRHLYTYENSKSRDLDLGVTTRYSRGGDGASKMDVAKFTIAECLYANLISAKTKQEAKQYLQAASLANQKAENGEKGNGFCRTLERIINLHNDWLKLYGDCLRNTGTHRAMRPELIANTTLFGKVLSNSKLSEIIVDLYNSLDANTYDFIDIELTNTSNKLPNLNLDALKDYYNQKSNSIDIGNGSGLTELDAGKYFLTRWLRIKTNNTKWNNEKLPLILMAASNINEQLESGTALIPMSTTLHSILNMENHIYSLCHNEINVVKYIVESEMDQVNAIRDDDELNDFEWVSHQSTPCIISTGKFLGFTLKSELSRRITELYNGIAEYQQMQENLKEKYSYCMSR